MYALARGEEHLQFFVKKRGLEAGKTNFNREGHEAREEDKGVRDVIQGPSAAYPRFKEQSTS